MRLGAVPAPVVGLAYTPISLIGGFCARHLDRAAVATRGEVAVMLFGNVDAMLERLYLLAFFPRKKAGHDLIWA
jgi:hypothetical protein